MIKRIVQNIKTKKPEKSEKFLVRRVEKKNTRLRAFARTRAKNLIFVRKKSGFLDSGLVVDIR